MHDQSVIAAIASPVGACARIVLRVSGKGSYPAVSQLLADHAELPRRGAVRVRLNVRGMVFPALVLLFEEGRSYTGEESAELHLPGNVILARQTLEALYDAGARPAEPGEFTARAFLNGRMDLTEAEGVACAITATNERELDAARRLQGGELTARLRPIIDELTQMLALLEAGIDFSEEDIRFLTPGQVRDGAAKACGQLERLLRDSARFERLTHEPVVVLCGKPNAGKSTLLNALAGRERAVVSPAAGTTRDLVSADVMLARGTVRMVDTAGLAERSEVRNQKSEIEIEMAMRERAQRAIETADVIVLVKEAGDESPELSLSRKPSMTVISKGDMAGTRLQESRLIVSALTGIGMDALRKELDDLAFGSRGGEELALNARHVRQLEAAIAELRLLRDTPPGTDELVAEHLRFSIDAIGEITGIVSTEDVLGRIFSTFCIGK